MSYVRLVPSCFLVLIIAGCTTASEHDEILKKLESRRAIDELTAWDFSPEHMFRGDEEILEMIWKYVKKEGSGQKIIDEITGNPNDEFKLLFNIQLAIILDAAESASKSTSVEYGTFRKNYAAGKYSNMINKFKHLRLDGVLNELSRVRKFEN